MLCFSDHEQQPATMLEEFKILVKYKNEWIPFASGVRDVELRAYVEQARAQYDSIKVQRNGKDVFTAEKQLTKTVLP